MKDPLSGSVIVWQSVYDLHWQADSYSNACCGPFRAGAKHEGRHPYLARISNMPPNSRPCPGTLIRHPAVTLARTQMVQVPSTYKVLGLNNH